MGLDSGTLREKTNVRFMEWTEWNTIYTYVMQILAI